MNEFNKSFVVTVLLAVTCINFNVQVTDSLDGKSVQKYGNNTSVTKSVKFVVDFAQPYDERYGNVSSEKIRRKRQSGGGSTSVVGARITQDATAGDWQSANFAINDAASPPPSRGKRSVWQYNDNYLPVHHHNQLETFYKPPAVYGLPKHEPMTTTTTPRPRRRFLTRTQELFDVLNRNSEAAQLYTQLNDIKSNPVLSQSIIVNPGGIKCDEICDPQGVGFALLGFCSEYFCRCNFETWQHVEYICPEDKIFDPVKLICESPSDTFLCSDPQPVTHYGVVAQPVHQPVSYYGPPTQVFQQFHNNYGYSYSYGHFAQPQPQPQSHHPVFTLLSTGKGFYYK